MNYEELISHCVFNADGLIPVIAQDASTSEVLMLAWANKEAIGKTLTSGYVHYFSRSRNKLWMKGETSGNVQKLVSLKLDCDGDCLLAIVEQTGPTCHTGAKNCFFREVS